MSVWLETSLYNKILVFQKMSKIFYRKDMRNNSMLASDNKGFTLVEIMIALAISGIVLASVYTAFQSQQESYVVQDQVAEMQQNLRSAVNIMSREIRMAGCDPLSTSGAAITAASINSLSFTMDLRGALNTDPPDGDTTDPGENITYSLYVAADGIQKLGRKNPNINQAVAEYIENIEFNYTLANGTQTTSPAASQLDAIRSIQISILARAANPDRNFTNTQTYTTASGGVWDPTPDDNFRRRLMIVQAKCRNMGL